MPTLGAAARYLSGLCDFAQERDGAGFNKPDSHLGHFIAGIPEELWTPAHSRIVWQMLRKYRGQLAGGGLDYDQIPEPPQAEPGTRAAGEAGAAPAAVTSETLLAQARAEVERQRTETALREAEERRKAAEDAAEARRQAERPRLVLVGECLVFMYKFDAALNDAVRRIPGRTFDVPPGLERKWWHVPVAPAMLPALAAFVEAYPVFLETAQPDVLALIEAARNAPPVAPAKPVRVIELAGKELLLRWEQGDPAFMKIKDDLKESVSGRLFDGNRKCWRVPLMTESLDALLAFAARWEFEYGDAVTLAYTALLEQSESNLIASRAEDADIQLPEEFGITPRPFQRGGIAYGLDNERVIIGDEMGLGKTFQGLGVLAVAGAFPALVVCPASVKLNWGREAGRALPHRKVVVLDGRNDRTSLAGADVVIVNYDLLSSGRAKDAGGRTIRNKIVPSVTMQTLQTLTYGAVICDESHSLKESTSQRFQALRLLVTGVKYRLLLSGTAVINKPAELVPQLELLERLDDFGGRWDFLKRYTQATHNGFGWSFAGAQNLDELNERLRRKCYIRRLKSDVAKELPPKQRSVIPVTLSNQREYDRAERDTVAYVGESARLDRRFYASITGLAGQERDDAIKAYRADAVQRARRAEHLTRIAVLRELAGHGKIKAATEWIRDFLDGSDDQKLVVFAHHIPVQEALLKEFPDAASVLGGYASAVRQANVDRFQTDPACRVIVCSLQAAGVGITLTAASNVAFVELGWTPALHDQAEDRCHRIGIDKATVDSVNAWYLNAEGTIDDEMWTLLQSKRAVVNATLNGADASAQAEDGPDENMLAGLLKALRRKGNERAQAQSADDALPDDEEEQEVPAYA